MNHKRVQGEEEEEEEIKYFIHSHLVKLSSPSFPTIYKGPSSSLSWGLRWMYTCEVCYYQTLLLN